MRLKHRCCFCMRRAKHWAKTDATTRKVCEPGHLKKGRFEKVFDRAARAHAEDAERIVAEESPLYGMAREPGAE